MFTLVIEALYALVFLRSLAGYLRRPDPLRRDLTIVFAPFTSLLVLEVVRRAIGVATLPVVVTEAAVTLLLAQPYLTMRLVRTLRPVSRWITGASFGVFVVTAVAFYLLGQRNLRPVTLAIVVGYFVVQGLAAVLLAGEARRRTGAPQVRLWLAATATAVLGLCLLAAGAGGSAGPAAQVSRVTAEVLALASGVSYLVAFMPPRWLRNMWTGAASYQIHQRLLSAPDLTPGEIWNRYAVTVQEISGAAGALVILPDGNEASCVAASGKAGGDLPATSVADIELLLAQPQPVVVPDEPVSPPLRCARRADAQVVIAVPLRLPTSERGALVLLSSRRPLFVEDDARLLGELGVQAAILAERGAAAEAIVVLNAELEQRVLDRTAELRVAQTAVENVNRQLEAQNATLERSNEELQRFAYVASHDLQEPLRKIISFSGLLVERVPDKLEPDAQMCLERIVGSSTRMQRLIEDLLMFSRAGGAVDPRAVDCDVALRAALESLALQIDESSATVTCDPLPVIWADRTPVEQLFQNLIGNALKYRSDAPPRIHVASQALDGLWRLTVTDNGIGVDMLYAERIFQVFQRLHPRGRYEGTGIGLALCKRIVESYGGRIGVDSIPGVGSTFWFVLPAAAAEQTQEVRDAVAHHAG